MKSLFDIPFDQYQRYEICSRLIKDISNGEKSERLNILDVGGFFTDKNGDPWLPAVEFLDGAKVKVIDTVDCTMPNYEKNDGRNLSFKDDSFDVVISNDVLEHITEDQRTNFIQELIRVSKKYVILNCPIYSKKNSVCEKILYEFIINQLGGENRMLEEHLLNGLPDENSIEKSLIGYNFVKYKSGEIDNWLILMSIRHWLMKDPRTNQLIELLDSYFNQFHFENEMNLEEGYRITYIIAKGEERNLLNSNFLNSVPKKTQNPKINLPFSLLTDLIKITEENEQRGVLNQFYYHSEELTPRLSPGTKFKQTFYCNEPNLYKIELLTATYSEVLSGGMRFKLQDNSSGKNVIDKIIDLKYLEDNDWFKVEFTPIFDSKGKEYEIGIEMVSDDLGPSFYLSEKNDYGKLMCNEEINKGCLSIKTYIRLMNAAEKTFFLEQEVKKLTHFLQQQKIENTHLLEQLTKYNKNEILLEDLNQEREKNNLLYEQVLKLQEELKTQRILLDNNIQNLKIEYEEEIMKKQSEIDLNQEQLSSCFKEIEELKRAVEITSQEKDRALSDNKKVLDELVEFIRRF